MARLEFSKLSVLIVEDGAFMRSIYVNVLRALGVDQISIAEDGEQAIRRMGPTTDADGAATANANIDIILCDYFMPVVDGAMFLRWVRRSEKSPDRFVPIIMVSAAADRDVLYKARDAGMDEFLAKPFSVETLAQRIASVVENQRPYIYCSNYFGPERRRRHRVVKADRRVTAPGDVETVYSGKDMAALRHSDKPVWEFRLPRKLRQKLANNRSTGNDSEAFDPALIMAADAKITEMESDYSDWIAQSIEDAEQSCRLAQENPQRSHGHLQMIHKIALELRGQGGIFGYPLVTQFGKSLSDVTGADARPSPQLLELIDAHLNLIKTVTRQKIKGEGGEIGLQLLNSLDEANHKFGKARYGQNETTAAVVTTVLP